MLRGKGVSSGIAIGKVKIIESNQYVVSKTNIDNASLEIEKLTSALETSKRQIIQLRDKTLLEVGESEAEIFDAHLMFLDDQSYIGEIEKLIEDEKINADYSVKKITEKYVELFNSLEDTYLKERVADLKDVSSRIIENILGVDSKDYALNEEVIIVAKDLTPSDTASLDKQHVLGFLTEDGGATSHTAIMARTLEIPAIVGVEDFDTVGNGDFIIMDGETGEIIKNPSEQQLITYNDKKKKLSQNKEVYRQYVNKETITVDDKKVMIAANIGNIDDLDAVLKNGSEGIGLFRTELFYLERTCLPTEEEQYQVYKKIAEKMEGKPVIIRTLDVGGDKEIPYMDLPKEMNPFLGYRAIRLCIDKQDILLTQLKAILRASYYGDIKILFPMISSMEELIVAKKILSKAKQILEDNGELYDGNIEVGMMIEVPSVALMSDLIAKEVDFFSIGTNDLIQYTVAVDRGNKKVSHLYNEFNPGVIRLINQVIKNAHNEGIWVSMCGEAASNKLLVPLLIAMGLDEFSMNSVMVPEIRCLINNIKYEETKELLNLFNCSYTEEIKEKLVQFVSRTVNKGS